MIGCAGDGAGTGMGGMGAMGPMGGSFSGGMPGGMSGGMAGGTNMPGSGMPPSGAALPTLTGRKLAHAL